MLFKRADINAAVEECRNTPGAVNLPLSEIETAILDKQAAIFAYCLRGTRSRKAAGMLARMGYAQVKSIGGITRYKGALER